MVEYPSASEVIRKALEDFELKFEHDEDVNAFVFNMNIPSQISSVRFILRPTADAGFQCVASLAIGGKADDREMMLSLSELLTRINYQILHGKFTMDFSDGELRWELPYAGWGHDELPSTAIMAALAMSIQMVSVYAPCILAVIFGGQSAEDALKLRKEE